MTRRRQCDGDWRETVLLRDGTRAQLRRVRPEDKQLFREAFDRLSPGSRYRRFFTAKTRLTDRDLRYLTEVDGEHHFALGATRGTGKAEQGLGVARFVRSPADPEVAEAAVVVTDDAQGKGLGRALLGWLVVAARERGVRRFECQVMQGNDPVIALLREHVPAAELVPQPDGSVSVRVPLEQVCPPKATTPIHGAPFRLLRLAAREAVEIRHQLGEAFKAGRLPR